MSQRQKYLKFFRQRKDQIKENKEILFDLLLNIYPNYPARFGKVFRH